MKAGIARNLVPPDEDISEPATATAALADSPPDPVPEAQLRQASAGSTPRPIELLQVSHLRGSAAHFAIISGRFLSVLSKRFGRRTRHYCVDLSFLDPTPHFFVKIDWPSLYVAGVLLVATSILVIVSLFSSTPWQDQAWLPATVLCGTGALVTLLVFLYRSRSLVRFHSQHGDAVFVELFNNNPRRKEFGSFIRALIQTIQALQKVDRRKEDQKLGAELREHRRLRDERVLTEDVYDRAREKILRRHKQIQAPVPAAAQPAEHEDIEADIIEVTVVNGSWHTSVADVSDVDLFAEEKPQAAGLRVQE